MKKWQQHNLDRLDRTEKIQSKQTRNFKKSNNENQTDFELCPSLWDEKRQEKWFDARVVEVHKRYVFVSAEQKEFKIKTNDVWLASIARRHTQSARTERNYFAVGDRVLCRPGSEDGDEIAEDLPSCVIEHRAPRSNKICRLDPMASHREQIIACNMTQILIVSSYVFPSVKWGLIDRYLLLAEEQGVKATIILNKKDLLNDQDDSFIEECKQYQALYENLGYNVISIQANKKKSKEKKALVELLKGSITLLSGHSGVGKSSLVNLLAPEIQQAVEDEEILSKGRHTTSYASLIKLAKGGFVIDTPGVRSFLLRPRNAVDLSWGFVEMRPYINQCKYRECRHLNEPSCAVITAVKNGSISEWRYRSYIAILTGASGREGRVRDIKI